MRIRVIQKPTVSCIDGIQLDLFLPGMQYEVGNTVGALFLAEGWAVPAPDDAPALLIPLNEFRPDLASDPPNLEREFFPPYLDVPPALAAERRRARRKRPL